jgi:hypothetical protein
VLGLALGGCPWSEGKFVDKYVEVECELLYGCYEQSVNDFLGWSSVDDCIADRGVYLVSEAQGCTYDKKAAKPCVKALELVTCPSAGDLPAYPNECDAVYHSCEIPTPPLDSGP